MDGDGVAMLNRSVTLTVSVDAGLTQVVTCFVEKSSVAFGFSQEECPKLTLAAEEVFTFLASTAPTKDEIQILCRGRGYCVELEFHLKRGMLPLEAFNLTRKATVDDAEHGGQLGLILAARIVDRLFVDRVGNDSFALRFVVEKRYPPAENRPLPELGGAFHVVDSDPSTLKELSARIVACHNGSVEPFLTVPGKLIDMVASGDFEALVLGNEKGQAGGGIVFSRGRHICEAYGPFVFVEEPSLPQALVEGMLEALGRADDALAVVIMEPAPLTPVGYFEKLAGGALYRQLSDDNGARVFVHPSLKVFLENFYEELTLPRILQEAEYQGEQLPLNSAIATTIDRPKKRAELRLLWTGQNFEDNLRAHVRLLIGQDVHDIRFRMELDSSDEAMMAPMLLSAGFSPWMVLPWDGRGDVAIFRHGER